MSTYYKILPEGLNCKGFQYQEGLNIDTKEITPYKCDNGLHFSDAEHILHFCNYGSVIAEVEIPEDAIVYHFDDKSNADKIILKNLRPLWSIETMEALISEGVEFESFKSRMLDKAAQKGYLDIVKYLIEHGANININEQTICCALERGHFDVVEYLIEHGANIHAGYDYALRHASEYGHLEIVKYLVEHGADIHTYDDYALRAASTYGFFEIVKYLVEQGADIHTLDDSALRWASVHGYFDTVRYLVEQGADIHACDDYAIWYAGTPEIRKYLKSLA